MKDKLNIIFAINVSLIHVYDLKVEKTSCLPESHLSPVGILLLLLKY